MPLQLFDHVGQPVLLGAPIGRGGEAEVFELPGARVAKIYHNAPDALKAAKLGHMVRAGTPGLLRVAAWPLATLHDRPRGPMRGFAMSRMTGFKELHLLYGTISRRREFPARNWDFLVQVAINCAAVFDTMHAAGTIIGDVNAKNLMASGKDATVCLIDCDSFQFRVNDRAFLCEVGVPEYTPPELQGKSFAGIVRTANHDCFGLAVLTFQLLFLGRHPFFGRYLGSGDMPQERAIQELRFAFGHLASAKQMASPPHVMPFSILPRAVADLFERAFAEASIRTGRPAAMEWLKALASLKSQLTTCAVDSSHKFPTQAGACPWCAIAYRGGPVFFMHDQLALDFTCSPGDLDAIISELCGLLGSASALPILTSSPVPAPAPRPLSRLAQAARQRARFACLTFVCSAAGFVVSVTDAATTSNAAIVCASIASAAVIWHAWVQRRSVFARERRERTTAVSEAEQQHQQAFLAHEKEAGTRRENSSRCKWQMDQLRASYVRLQDQYNAELAELARNGKADHRRAYLQAFDIRSAIIDQMDSAKKRSLVSCGIETAYDVLHGNLTQVSGIGPTLRSRLLDWARSKDLNFRFDPGKALPEGTRRTLVARYRHLQVMIRGNLEALTAQFKFITAGYASKQKQLVTDVISTAAKLRKAQSNVTVMSNRTNRIMVGSLALVVIWLMIAMPHPANTGQDAATAARSTPAPSAKTVMEESSHDQPPGIDLLTPGTGISRILSYEPRDGQKQRMELTLEAELDEEAGASKLPRITMRALVVASKNYGSFCYIVTIEAIRLSDREPLGALGRAVRRSIHKLVGSSLSITASSQATILAVNVEKHIHPDVSSSLVLNQLRHAMSSMFIETPELPVATGARWRIRRDRTAAIPQLEESTVDATAVTPTSQTLQQSAKLSPLPASRRSGDDGVTGVEGSLSIHLELRPEDLIPTVTSTYDVSADVRGKSGPFKIRQRQKVSIRPL
jgi:DNA-binding helix-hairpin-helix protein with protein kinase domain